MIAQPHPELPMEKIFRKKMNSATASEENATHNRDDPSRLRLHPDNDCSHSGMRRLTEILCTEFRNRFKLSFERMSSKTSLSVISPGSNKARQKGRGCPGHLKG